MLTGEFRNDCAYCDEVEACPKCNNRIFCVEHWKRHPACPPELHAMSHEEVLAAAREKALDRELELMGAQAGASPLQRRSLL